jgi:excisionase family DNA binding protein
LRTCVEYPAQVRFSVEAMMDEQQLLSISEAAERYHIPVPTLRNALQQGHLKGYKIGKQWVIYPTDIEAYLKNPPRRGRPAKKRL